LIVKLNNAVPDSKPLVPKRIYSYKCGGTLANGNLSGKSVEWKVIFDKPIEQFIYPSLQLFDTNENDPSHSIAKSKPPENARKFSTIHQLPGSKRHSIGVSFSDDADDAPPAIKFPLQRAPSSASLVPRIESEKSQPTPLNIPLSKTHANTTWEVRVTDEILQEDDDHYHDKNHDRNKQDITNKGESFLRAEMKTSYAKFDQELRALAQAETMTGGDGDTYYRAAVMRKLSNMDNGGLKSAPRLVN